MSRDEDPKSVVAYGLVRDLTAVNPQIVRMVTRAEMLRFQYSGDWMPLHRTEQMEPPTQRVFDELRAEASALRGQLDLALQQVARLQDNVRVQAAQLERQRERREAREAREQACAESFDDEATAAEQRAIRARAAELVIGAWHADVYMKEFINQVCPEDDHSFKHFGDAMGFYCSASIPVRAWVRTHMRTLSDVLWAGRPNAVCENVAKRAFGFRPHAIARAFLHTRENDKTHDWQTVK